MDILGTLRTLWLDSGFAGFFADGGWMAVRPSGTEPKIKFYYSVKGESMKAAEDKVESLGNAVKELMA